MESKAPTIGLLADPGTPEWVASRIADAVAERLSRQAEEPCVVEISKEKLPLSPEGTLDLVDHAQGLRSRHGWDYVVYLTDLPRFEGGHPVLCEVSAEARSALVAVPMVGALRLTARTRDLVVALVRTAMFGTEERPTLQRVSAELGGPDVQEHPSGAADLIMLVLTGRTRNWRLLSGMVRSNRPGQLLPALSGCIAAAVAAGAFGVFYGTMAPVADSLPVWRLALLSLLVSAILTAWLILRNNLWNSERGGEQMWRPGLDNASTVITVGASVIVLYALLMAIMLILAVAVLTTSYLEGELLHRIGALDYLKVAWLTASMGTMAGALGANFDSEDAVREATYSRRYHERRKLFDTYEEQEQR